MADPTPAPAPAVPAQAPAVPAPAAPMDLWDSVTRLHGWLTAHDRHPPEETLLLRMLKLSEEVGEVAQAVIGATGQNPRKGTTHSWEDVQSELCDVVITALVALRTLTPEPERALDARLRTVVARSAAGPRGRGAAEIQEPPGT
ncbi:MazG-like family protein [Streptomyces aureocirculatus]|uniref:MazG-like family protein n=1 Tax=Streptomyces aureocirculatus TaxID=67275 RepID=UPI0004C618E0|nr:MazG-like family protein [Streptomyces aureocirculatus]